VAVLFATGVELAMLLTPYTDFFGMQMTARFVIVTFAAHAIFARPIGRSAGSNQGGEGPGSEFQNSLAREMLHQPTLVAHVF
jgi:hypothetical protein